ncbi:MAG: hypothetical protein K2Q20_08095 [Phycisphaerales bacterium]|nr:hypothetical protein [Phycisphaerales bacterium]
MSTYPTPGDALATAAGLPPGSTLDPQRTAEVAALLVEFASGLDQAVWNTWKVVAPASSVKRAQPLKQTLATALGDPGADKAQLKAELDRLRQLTAALAAAINQAGRQFAKEQVERLAPSEIETLAKMSGGGLLTAHETKCWRKYVELTAGRDASTVQGELMKAIATYTETLLGQAAHASGGPGPGGASR